MKSVKSLQKFIALGITAPLVSISAAACTTDMDSAPEDQAAESDAVGESADALVGAPNCWTPINCVTEPDPWFQWTAVQGAASYRIVAWKYPNGQEQWLGGWDTPSWQTYTKLSWLNGQTLQPYVLYRWKVKGEGPGGYDPGPYCGNNGIGKYVYYSPQGC